MERRAQDVADLEHAAPRKFPLWANVRYPGRYFGRDLCVALRCTNVPLSQGVAPDLRIELFARCSNVVEHRDFLYTEIIQNVELER